jgi:hypothetical protein
MVNLALLQTLISISLHTFFAKSFIPVKSISMQGSSSTTHESCPGGITAVSPAPPSTSVPSSILVLILPEITYAVCEAWQPSVLTSGLIHFSQLQPGSNVPLPYSDTAIRKVYNFNLSFFKCPYFVR